MLLADLVATSAAVASTRSRNAKAEHLADLLRRLAEQRGTGEIGIGVSYLAGELPQGKIGVGPATLRSVRPDGAAAEPSLSLTEVDATFSRIAAQSGAGSNARREEILGDLLARATADEQPFLAGLVIGELRQGALAGLMVDGLARATGAPVGALRRALMVTGDLPLGARTALEEGEAGLDAFRMEVFRPLQPMLAQTAEGVEEALGRLERAAFDWKLDGARVQVHKSGDEVRAWSRRMNEVTDAVPEVVEAVRGLPAEQAILDGEVLALTDAGTPHPFQVTMRRFGRRLDVDALRRELPLSPFFFDLLMVDGDELLERPAEERFAALDALVPEALRVPRLVTADPAEAAAFLRRALDRGHEGVMAKDPASGYEAGGRGYQWLKVKPVHTLDLVVLAAEWGSGRRRGWLSNLHLGARLAGDADPDAATDPAFDPAFDPPFDPGRADRRHTDGWVMLGKTFKGMTDRMLEWQTERLQELETERTRRTVYVRPELVVEVAFNDVQASPQYPGGLALRFARVKGYRPDKSAAEADTLATVRDLYRRQGGAPASPPRPA